MGKHKNRSQARPIWLTFLGLFVLGLLIAVLLKGSDVRLFNPKGFIAQQQLDLMVLSVLLILAIAVPTMIILYSFAWEYRESNQKATYDPEARHGKFSAFSMWAVPTAFMIVLALIVAPAVYRLEPRKSLASEGTKPLTIQVVAMRWKWVFFYPEQNIATVNFVQIPVGTPVEFEITADETPMSSFWIPHFSGQLYAMTGHVNRLNILANETGDYPGSSAEINGRGFAGMKFTARASSQADFNKWLQDIKQSPTTLDTEQYEALLKPSENNPIALYSSYDTNLYSKMLMKYTGSKDGQPQDHGTGH